MFETLLKLFEICLKLFPHVGCQKAVSKQVHILDVKCRVRDVSHVGCRIMFLKRFHILDIKLFV